MYLIYWIGNRRSSVLKPNSKEHHAPLFGIH